MKRRGFSCCDHCGGAGVGREVRPVRVSPLRLGVRDVDALNLCRSCRTDPHRTWRLHWQEVGDEVAS